MKPLSHQTMPLVRHVFEATGHCQWTATGQNGVLPCQSHWTATGHRIRQPLDTTPPLFKRAGGQARCPVPIPGAGVAATFTPPRCEPVESLGKPTGTTTRRLSASRTSWSGGGF
jgi:hypothetical protein